MDSNYLSKLQNIGNVPQPKVIELEAPKPTVPDVSLFCNEESFTWKDMNLPGDFKLNLPSPNVSKNKYDPNAYASPVLSKENLLATDRDGQLYSKSDKLEERIENNPILLSKKGNDNISLNPVYKTVPSPKYNVEIENKLKFSSLAFHRYNLPVNQSKPFLKNSSDQVMNGIVPLNRKHEMLDNNPNAIVVQTPDTTDCVLSHAKNNVKELEDKKKDEQILYLQNLVNKLSTQLTDLMGNALLCQCSKKKELVSKEKKQTKIAIVQTSFEDYKPETASTGTITEITSNEIIAMLDVCAKYVDLSKDIAREKHLNDNPVFKDESQSNENGLQREICDEDFIIAEPNKDNLRFNKETGALKNKISTRNWQKDCMKPILKNNNSEYDQDLIMNEGAVLRDEEDNAMQHKFDQHNRDQSPNRELRHLNYLRHEGGHSPSQTDNEYLPTRFNTRLQCKREISNLPRLETNDQYNEFYDKRQGCPRTVKFRNASPTQLTDDALRRTNSRRNDCQSSPVRRVDNYTSSERVIKQTLKDYDISFLEPKGFFNERNFTSEKMSLFLQKTTSQGVYYQMERETAFMARPNLQRGGSSDSYYMGRERREYHNHIADEWLRKDTI